MEKFVDGGYYWVREPDDDNTTFIVYYEDGLFYCCGVENPINAKLNLEAIICPVKQALH